MHRVYFYWRFEMLSFILLIAGLAILVKCADIFVDGSSNIAKAFGIPSLIIGLTIVAFGTSAPEAAVSITAGIKGSNEISIGNVVGSNICNSLLILGFCGLFKALINPANNQILGVTLYGAESYELINQISMAMKMKIPANILRDQIYTHPTMSESFNDLFK